MVTAVGRSECTQAVCPVTLPERRVVMATARRGPEVRHLPGLHGERLTLLVSGVAPLLLGLAGLIVLEGPADRPELDQPPVMILDYFSGQDTVILGSFLLMLAAMLFLWFAGCLRAGPAERRGRRRAPEHHRLRRRCRRRGVHAGDAGGERLRRAVRRLPERAAGADALPHGRRLPVSGGDGGGGHARRHRGRRAARPACSPAGSPGRASRSRSGCSSRHSDRASTRPRIPRSGRGSRCCR